MPRSTDEYWVKLEKLRRALYQAEVVVIGAGAGLSTAAGFEYGGERFERYFHDFKERYGFEDMYAGGFYPYESLEAYWGFWSQNIYVNRYVDAPKPVYEDLRRWIGEKEYFVLTTNVDHCFQKAGFAKERLFYTQGDYGLWQCAKACHAKTYDNEETVRKMVEEERDLLVPTELVPYCPICGAPMTMNLRIDSLFVEDAGWQAAAERYQDFLERYRYGRVLYLELGVGGNTPGIIKYPFWRMTGNNEKAVYACINAAKMPCPEEIEERSIMLQGDIGEVLRQVK